MNPERTHDTGRLPWVAVAVVLVLLVGLSFIMSSGARQDAEAAAETRAEGAVALLAGELTPELVEADIVGSAYRELLPRVQSAVMSDDRVIRVRIWKPDGDLIFSTAAQDATSSFVAVENVQIRQAADGQVASVVAEASAAPPAGLEGSEQDLFVTYVPLRFADQTETTAVVEIDQAYSAVQETTNRIWRPVQVGLIIALAGLALLFAMSQRRHRTRPYSRWNPKPERVSRDALRFRDAEDRAIAAERAAREGEARLAEAERRLDELTSAEIPPEVRGRIEELERSLRSEHAERDQLAGEAKRLRSALSEREAALALIRDKTISTEAEKVRSIDAVQRAEQQVAEAERRAGAAGTLAAESEARAAKAEAKVLELEIALRDADRRLEEAVEEARRSDADSRKGEETRAVADLRGARLEVADLQLKLSEAETALRGLEAVRAEAETALRGLEAFRAEGEAAQAELVRIRGEAEGARAELEGAQSELQRVRLELDTSRGERDGARAELQASQTELETARTGLETARLELDRREEELKAARTELDRRGDELARVAAERDALAASPADDGSAVDTSEHESRLADLEAERRREMAELQRAHESLANTQVELMEATRRLRASEDRVRELERLFGGPVPATVTMEEPADPVAAVPPGDRPARRRPPLEPQAPAPIPVEDAATEDEAPEEPADETLSLRERLARAAAARHRTAQPPD